MIVILLSGFVALALSKVFGISAVKGWQIPLYFAAAFLVIGFVWRKYREQ